MSEIDELIKSIISAWENVQIQVQQVRQVVEKNLVKETAKLFHDTYEKLAPKHGYKTRELSAADWDSIPENNKALMIETVEVVLRQLLQTRQGEGIYPYELCHGCVYKKVYDAQLLQAQGPQARKEEPESHKRTGCDIFQCRDWDGKRCNYPGDVCKFREDDRG